VWDVALLPDSARAVTASADHTLRIWDLAAGTSRVLAEHRSWIAEVAVSASGRYLALTGGDTTVRALRLDGQEVFATDPVAAGHARFAPAVDRLAMRAGSALAVWEPEAGLRSFPVPFAQLMELRFSPSGAQLALCGHDGRLGLLELASGRLRDLPGACEPYAQLAFSADGRLLAYADQDLTVGVIDVDTAEVRARLRGHTARVFRLVFSPDGRFVASASGDGTVRSWDLAAGSARVLIDHRAVVVRLVLSRDGAQLISGAGDGEVRLWTDPFSDPVPVERRAVVEWIGGMSSAVLSEKTVASPGPVVAPPG
jgi:WD40 repeat protein